MVDLREMRNARGLALALALGAGAAGCYTDGGSTGPMPLPETPQTVMSLCTAGPPGAPTCPFNQLSLDEVGAKGAVFAFLAQAVGNGVFLSELTLAGGPQGFSVERVILRCWDRGLVHERIFDEPLDIAPGSVAHLTSTATPLPARTVTIELEGVGPHLP